MPSHSPAPRKRRRFLRRAPVGGHAKRLPERLTRLPFIASDKRLNHSLKPAAPTWIIRSWILQRLTQSHHDWSIVAALAGSRVGDKPPAAQNATLPQGAGLIKLRAAESKRTLWAKTITFRLQWRQAELFLPAKMLFEGQRHTDPVFSNKQPPSPFQWTYILKKKKCLVWFRLTSILVHRTVWWRTSS